MTDPLSTTESDASRDLRLTHLDDQGRARMVDIGHKRSTPRRAVAQALVVMKETTRQLLDGGRLAKGDAWAAARLAGILAAKETPRLIPLAHTVDLTSVEVDFSWRQNTADPGRSATPSAGGGAGSDTAVLEIAATARATDRTGVEMEALVAASMAALTVYDMCKAVDRTLRVEAVELLEKQGGTKDFRKG